MGSVWAARNELTNRDFAVKFLLPDLVQKEDALNRFFLEARACGQIRHPAIVDVYDMGQADDSSPYLVMELLEGEGMDQRIQRQGQLRPVDVCRYTALVASGLEEAHARGLIHRDLKPGNIFFSVDKRGEVYPKVLDFGISKEVSSESFEFVKTSTGTVLGSPAYMSPEQARGEADIDARSDVWSLGIIMYEALTGELPFDAQNYTALMLCIISTPHRPVEELAPEAPPELSALIDRALMKDRSKRIRSAGELASALEEIYVRLTDTPFARPERSITIAPETTTQNGWFKVRTAAGGGMSATAMLLLVLTGVVAVAGAGFALSRDSGPPPAPAAKMGSAIDAVVARAQVAYAEAVAREETQRAEAAARDAEHRAEAAAKTAAEVRAEQEQRLQAPRGAGNLPQSPSKAAAPKAHGGVVGPGF
jgi:serine/threonine-protein kinase